MLGTVQCDEFTEGKIWGNEGGVQGRCGQVWGGGQCQQQFLCRSVTACSLAVLCSPSCQHRAAVAV